MLNRSDLSLPSIFEPYSCVDWNRDDRVPMPLDCTAITQVHYHDTMEISLCVDGYGEVLVDGVQESFQPGDVVVVFPFQQHYSCKTSPGGCTWYWLYLDPLFLLNELSVSDLPRIERMLRTGMGLSGKIDRQRYPFIAELLTRVARPGDKDLRLTYLYTVIKEMAAQSRGLPCLTIKPTQGFDQIEPAIDLAGAMLDRGEAPRVEKMARACHMSVASFRRAFHTAMGQSPQAYIEASRMKKARYLLIGTSLPISRIAEAVGYQDVSGFNRKFSENFKMTPREFRALYLQ